VVNRIRRYEDLEIAEECGSDARSPSPSHALAGVISGLSKQVKQMGIEPKHVFAIDVKWTGKAKTRTFVLDDFFLHAGIEQNWPDA